MSMANQFFKLDGLVEMVTRRVSEDFNGFLANASGYQNTQFQKLICPEDMSNIVDTVTKPEARCHFYDS